MRLEDWFMREYNRKRKRKKEDLRNPSVGLIDVFIEDVEHTDNQKVLIHYLGVTKKKNYSGSYEMEETDYQKKSDSAYLKAMIRQKINSVELANHEQKRKKPFEFSRRPRRGQ